MWESLMKQKAITLTFFILVLCSILCQIISGIIYTHMIRETEHIATTKNELLKQCKLKFANCYMMNQGVSNISVFVDKFLARLCVGGISLHRLSHFSGQFMMLSIVAAGFGAFQAILSGETLFQVMPFYLISMLGLYFYFSISGLVDLPGKKNLLKIALTDYLENHMMKHLELRRETMPEEIAEPTPVLSKEKQPVKTAAPFLDEELELLLKEFLY